MTDCEKQLRESVEHIADTLTNPPEVFADGDYEGEETNPEFPPVGLTYNAEDDEWTDSDGAVVNTRQMSAMDYLSDVLDIEYRVGSDKKYRSSEVLVAFGGPNIWIDTKTEMVRGAWWGDGASLSYTDNMGIDDALEELFSC